MPAWCVQMEAALQAVERLRSGDVAPGSPISVDEALAAVGDVMGLRSHGRHQVLTIGGLGATQADEGG